LQQLSFTSPRTALAGRTAVWLAAALLLAGCAVTPKPLTLAENSVQAQQDLASVIGKLEPLSGPLTLPQATARAIRNNLEAKVRQMETMAQVRQLDLSRYDMLPRLALSAGYSSRNNDAFGLGYQPNGTISSVPSSAVERSHSTYNAALTWNVLDFGLSYYRATQNADQVLVAEERRRRAIQNLVLDVRLAWWRAEAAQRLLPQIDAMLSQTERAAERSRLIESRRLLPPLQIIAYRRSLLDLQQQLSQKRQELSQWRSEFAELVGLRPGESYRLVSPDTRTPPLPELTTRADELEAMALERRPELAEERLRARITQVEGKRQLVSLLPAINLNIGANYDSNRFLINNQWNEIGSLVTFNLLKLLSLPAMKRSQETQEQLDRARRESVIMAVMTQTQVAVNRYELLRHELGIWNQAVADDQSLLKAMQSTQEAGLETELELIRSAARLSITEINRDTVHANLEHAMGRVMNSVGYDVVTAQTDAQAEQGATLAGQLETALGGFERQHFALMAEGAMRTAAIGRVTGLPTAAQPAFRDAMRTVMRVVQIPLADSGAAVVADVAVVLGPRSDSGRPVEMKVSLNDAGTGNVLHVAQMKSMLVEPVSEAQWKVLGEAAVFKSAETLRRLLGSSPALPRDTLSMTEGGALKLDRNWSGPRMAPSALQ
jgi:outer membrane protein TolC